MTAPAPGYPPGPPSQYQQQQQQQYPYAQYPPIARPPRRPRWTGGLLGGILLLIATGITVWGSFGVVQTLRRDREGDPVVFEVQEKWWSARQGRPTAEEESLLFGLPLILAAALLLTAALLALSAITSRRSGLVTATRVIGGVGLGLMAGAFLLQLLEGLEVLNNANNANPAPGESITFEMGLGIWLPGAALLIGLIGLVMVLTGTGGRVEPDTPPMGWVALQRPMDHLPGQQPTQFPASQPIQQAAPVQQPATGPASAQQPFTGPTPAQQPFTGPTPVQQPATPPAAEPPAAPPVPPPAAEQPRPPETEPPPQPPADETPRPDQPDDSSRN